MSIVQKRIYIRVPITGDAVVCDESGVQIKTNTIDISPGGVGLVAPSTTLGPAQYQIEVTTAEGEKIEFAATLIREDETSVGFKTSDIDKENLQIIANLLAEFQTSNEFIKQMDAHDLLEQSFTDEDGNEVTISFEIGSEKE